MALRRWWPVAIVLVVSLGLLGWRLSEVDWQPRELAEIGSQFAEGDSEGTEGYDGQFVLFMAEDLSPQRVRERLDVPAYRYQRILLPVAARLLALGKVDWVPWTIILVNLAAHLAGTFALCHLLDLHSRWTGFGLLYGLWAGVLVGVVADLHEPLAYGLVIFAWWQRERGRPGIAILLLGLSLFAKETTLPFLAAFFLADTIQRRLDDVWPHYLAILATFGLWQGWLWLTFGEPGLGSGGAGATAFEFIPFMGLARVAMVDLSVFGLFLLLFGPGILLPAIWGVVRSVFDLVKSANKLPSWAMLLNAGVIMALPFSTFREPLGLVRLATGLILAVIFYAVANDLKRPLVYGWFWISYLVLIG